MECIKAVKAGFCPTVIIWSWPQRAMFLWTRWALVVAAVWGMGEQDREKEIWLAEDVLLQPRGDIDSMLKAFDLFSMRNAMGMHLGVEKGLVIEDAVAQALAGRSEERKSGPLVVLEVGAHMGDGTLRIFRALAAAKASAVVACFESNALWAMNLKGIVTHALVGRPQMRFEPRFVELQHTLLEAKAVLKMFGQSQFDFVVLDHDHGQYLPDLETLVRAGLLAPGAVVLADNAGRAARELRYYLDYVKTAPFTTRFYDVKRPYIDKVAVSTYSPTTEL